MRAQAALLVLVGLAALTSTLASSRTSGDPPLNADRRYVTARTQTGSGTGSETGDYLPPLAGPGSEITGTVIADSGSGPSEFFVATVDERGGHRYWKSTTDERGRFHLSVPQTTGGVVAFLLFKHFDAHGNPDEGAESRVASATSHLENTVTLANAPRTGPAIVEASTSYEIGGRGEGLIPLHVRDVDPLRARVLVDGGTHDVDTLAASDESVLGRFHDDTPLGRHAITVQSGSDTSNSEIADAVTLRFDPIGALHSGQVTPVRLHVTGLGSDPADATFTVGGAAALVTGAASQTVPVRDGVATVDVRAEHPGGLVVDTVLNVEIPQQVAQEVPSPAPTAHKTPRPFATGLLRVVVTPDNPTPTPPEIPVGHRPGEQLIPCSFAVTDGYMQPTQGFWQDDRAFPYPDILIRLGSPGDEPFYKAPYPLVVGRPTVVGGVYRYRWLRSGAEVTVDDRDDPKGHVRMTVMTNCPLPDVVRFHFAFVEGNAGTVWQSPTQPLASIPLHGMVPPGTPPKAYTVQLPAPLGYPERTAFAANSPGYYTLFCSLEKQDPTTGRWVGPLGDITVNVQLVVTHGPLIHFVPVVLFGDPENVDVLGLDLEDAAWRQARDTSHLLPDLYPLRPGGTTKTSAIPSVQEPYRDFSTDDSIAHPENHVHIPDDIRRDLPDLVAPLTASMAADVRRAAINTELARTFDLGAILSHAGRIVIVLDNDDFRVVAGPGVAAYTLSSKVVFVPARASYQTIGHEIAHTLPWDYTGHGTPNDISWMLQECRSGYHNQTGAFAQGLRFIRSGGQVAIRNDEQGASGGLMGPLRLNPYMEQCTSRHLTSYLRGIPDPPVVVVRGVLLTDGTQVAGYFDPFYNATSQVDTQGQDPNFHLSLRLLGTQGRRLRTVGVQSNAYGPEDAHVRRISAFTVRIPIVAGLQRVELWAGNRMLAARDATPFAPVVTIESPRAGSEHRQGVPFTLTWSARTAPGTSPSATVLDSTDGGRTFDVLTADQPAVIHLRLRGIGTHVLRVVVSDGWQSREADTEVVVRGGARSFP